MNNTATTYDRADDSPDTSGGCQISIAAAIPPASPLTSPPAAVPACAPIEPHAEAAPPIDATQQRGAPTGNQNRVSSGLRRSSGLPGSKLPRGCGRVETHVSDLIDRTRAAWRAKHGDAPMPLAAEVLVKQIRRAEERDRLAAKQLKDGTDLKGTPLTFDQQERLQAAQEAAGKLIEACLRKLGLGVEPVDAAADPWAALSLPPITAQPPAAAPTVPVSTPESPTEHPPGCTRPAADPSANGIGGGRDFEREAR